MNSRIHNIVITPPLSYFALIRLSLNTSIRLEDVNISAISHWLRHYWLATPYYAIFAFHFLRLRCRRCFISLFFLMLIIKDDVTFLPDASSVSARGAQRVTLLLCADTARRAIIMILMLLRYAATRDARAYAHSAATRTAWARYAQRVIMSPCRCFVCLRHYFLSLSLSSSFSPLFLLLSLFFHYYFIFAAAASLSSSDYWLCCFLLSIEMLIDWDISIYFHYYFSLIVIDGFHCRHFLSLLSLIRHWLSLRHFDYCLRHFHWLILIIFSSI